MSNLTSVESDYNNSKLEINIIHSQIKYIKSLSNQINSDSLKNMKNKLQLLESKLFDYQSLINKYKNEIIVIPDKQYYLEKLNQEKEVLIKTKEYISNIPNYGYDINILSKLVESHNRTLYNKLNSN